MNIQNKNIKRNWNIFFSRQMVIIFFFILFLICGILIFRDYGFPWDEIYQLDFSRINFNYVNQSDPSLLTYPFRYSGPFFETILLVFSRNNSLGEEIYARHFGVFVIFFSGLIFFFSVANRLLKDSWWALLATVLLASSPRIFANSFYNSKDIPFLVSAIICCWTLFSWIEYLEAKGKRRISLVYCFFHAGSMAICVTTRLPGVVFFIITALIFLFLIIQNREQWKYLVSIYTLNLVLFISLTLLFWPILWHDPLGGLINAFSTMKNFPYQKEILYFGKFYLPINIPWHYLPVWISISTPLIVLFGFVVSHLFLLFRAFHANSMNRLKQFRNLVNLLSQRKNWLIIIGWFYLPVVAVYLFHSVIYDGWRHMFFIYPAFVLFAIAGLKYLREKLSKRLHNPLISFWVCGIFLLIGLSEPISFIYRYHPYEYVYFNCLAGKPDLIRYQYDLDYWGLSYKQAIDYLLQHEVRNWFSIYAPTPAGLYYVQFMLPESQRNRIGIVNNPDLADYFLGDYRWHPQDYAYKEKYYSIIVQGKEIMVVYKLKR